MNPRNYWDTEFEQNEQVIVYNLGSTAPGEYRAKVVGVAATYPDVTFYILEMIDRIPNLEWSHCMMIGSCIKRVPSMVKNCQNRTQLYYDHIQAEYKFIQALERQFGSKYNQNPRYEDYNKDTLKAYNQKVKATGDYYRSIGRSTAIGKKPVRG